MLMRKNINVGVYVKISSTSPSLEGEGISQE